MISTTNSLKIKEPKAFTGKYEEFNDWRFKFGGDYIITGVDKIQDAVAFVGAITMQNGIGYKEWPCHWEEVPADFQTEMEKNQMEYEGSITYPAKRYNVSDYMKNKGA